MKVSDAGSLILLQAANMEDKVESTAYLTPISQTSAATNYGKETIYFLSAVPDTQGDILLTNKAKIIQGTVILPSPTFWN